MGGRTARVGDTGTHGAVIVTGAPNMQVNGIPVARLGDLVNCPLHGLNPIISVHSSVHTNALLTAHVSCVAACGAVITTGSGNQQR